MPSVKIPKKSTFVDMTPFVDVAFLILTFFIMATKFKPPDPVEVNTPKSVSPTELPESNATLITIDKEGKVYFTVLSQKDRSVYTEVINTVNSSRNLGSLKPMLAENSPTIIPSNRRSRGTTARASA